MNNIVNTEQHPYDTSSWMRKTIHILTHDWIFPLISRGSKGDLQSTDCYNVPRDDNTQHIIDLFHKFIKNHPSTFSILSFLWQIEKYGIISRLVWMSLAKLCQLIVPFLVFKFTDFFQDESQPFINGIYLSLFLLLSGIWNIMIFSITFIDGSRATSRIRSYLILSIYDKSLRMSSNNNSSPSSSSSMGQRITMISSDTTTIALCMGYVPVMLPNLVLMFAAIIFLYLEVGFAAFAGWCFMLIIGGPLQYIVGGKILNATRKYKNASDIRVKFIAELIKGIKITKIYCWEKALMDKVGEYRNEEMKRLLIRSKYMALASMMNIITPQSMALLLFTVYILTGNELTMTKVFTVISLIQLLRVAIKIMPLTVQLIIGCYVGCKRLDTFFDGIEHEEYPSNTDIEINDHEVICIKQASFTWSGGKVVVEEVKEGEVDDNEVVLDMIDKEHDDEFILEDITLRIGRGKLIALMGTVGSGKSSLIAAILNEMKMVNGDMNISDKYIEDGIGYMAQEAFIISGTVRDNIVFGLEYDDICYQRVLTASALMDDLEIFANGDKTEIGERGVNISGGQKQRVSFARILYRCMMQKGIELYLLDDPLSAVDVNVGNIMFHEGICNVLKGKTRIIVMNSHLDLLQYFDEVIVMDNGTILCHDKYENVINNEKYLHLLPNTNMNDGRKASNSVQGEDIGGINLSKLSIINKGEKLSTKQSEGEREKKGKLIVAEERASGSVPWSVYGQYFSNAADVFDYNDIKHDGESEVISKTSVFGVMMIIFEILLLFIAQSFQTMSDVWLSFYSEEDVKQRYSSLDDSWWLIIWSIFVLCLGICSFAASYLFGYLSTRSSMNVHKKTLYCVLRAPLSYFDSVPTGRILNRFSKDTNEMDNGLQINLNDCSQNILQIIGYLVIIIYSVPYILGILLFLIPSTYLLQKYYRKTSQSLKRLEQISFSPLITSFSETLLGLDTIRAFKLSVRFRNNFKQKLDINHKIYLTAKIADRWFAAYMELLVIILLFFVCLISCYLSRYGDDNIFETSLLSLSIIYSYSMTTKVQWTTKSTVNVDRNFTAVQRLLYYQNNIIKEANNINFDYRPPSKSEWPKHGQIVISNLSMRYRKDLDLVLNGINLTINDGEKIGICGRTGSGKSSLLLTLLRLIEPELNGEINIDGVNCLKLGLKDLRNNLSIIPQDAVLLSGSVRFNLDPFNEYNDDEIYDVLKKIEMYEFVTNKPNKLGFMVSENGSNFSKGQQQLICIGRALLKNRKILLLDEATSSIDKYTDHLIQNLIQNEFRDKTVLCIAHRLQTISNYDRIVVFDKGRIIECGTPNQLLLNRNGALFAMMNNI